MMFLLWTLIFGTGVLPGFAQTNAPIGGSAFLYPKNIVITPDHQKSWTMDGATGAIATLSPGIKAVYGGRCTAVKCELFPDGTLRMDQLVSTDNKTFILTAVLGSVTLTERIQLIVYNLLTPPTLSASPSLHPVNGTTLRLTCNGGTQTVHNIFFYLNEQIVICTMPHMSCNDSSPILNFNPVLDIDTGNYSCVIRNPVSQNSSAALSVNVAVRVSEVILRNNATRPITVEKDSVALTCSSYGTDVNYNWTFVGKPLPQNSRYGLTNNGATLIISPVTRSDQGSFVCMVKNSLNSDISNPLNLSWVPDGQIICDAQKSNQSLLLHCSWTGGYPLAQVDLLYQSIYLTEYDGVIVEVPFSQFPLGTPLSCTGTHQGVSESCSLIIDNPQYPGFVQNSTRTGRKGSSVFLSVTISSGEDAQIFPSKFRWYRLEPILTELFTGEDISIVSDDYSSFLIVHSVTQERIGRYMCKAENAIGTNSFSFNVEVEKEDDTLSGGAIAGIVIGSVAVLALIALTVVLVFKKRTSTPKPSSSETSDPPVDRHRNAYVPRPRGPIPRQVTDDSPEMSGSEVGGIYETVISDLRSQRSREAHQITVIDPQGGEARDRTIALEPSPETR